MSQTDPRWQFWLDVGGTFTDCVARRPDGRIERHKVLSSGVTKGRIGAGSSAERLVDPRRTVDPTDFWRGFQLRVFDEQGRVTDQRTVVAFDSAVGAFQLDAPLDAPLLVDAAYELTFGGEAPVLAIRYLLGLPLDAPLPPIAVRLGTTRGTNALLTRRGAPTALVVTRGFGDILHIGYQNRPRLFDLDIRKPPPLFAAAVEIDERLTIDGRVITPLDLPRVRQQLLDLRHARPEIESLAICLLNAYCQPQHERQVAELAESLGFRNVSVSHQVAPLIKLVSRGDTTVVDAYLNPVLSDYVASLRRWLGPTTDLRLLTSAGG
ncbi:MAG: hydantoinase/oxoprolinase N-terminal domain-containing protein [Pirellulales bacterium]